jgi:hypothetical protein
MSMYDDLLASFSSTPKIAVQADPQHTIRYRQDVIVGYSKSALVISPAKADYHSFGFDMQPS